MSLDDSILRMFIDQVFDTYDFDRSGYLDVNQLHTFFNQLFTALNEPRRFTKEQTLQFVSSIDFQHNGRITKPELFLLFKQLTSAPTSPNQYNYGGNNYGQQGQVYPPNQYGQQQQQYIPNSGQPYGQPQTYGQPQNYGQPQQPIYYTYQNNQGTNPNQFNPYK